MSVYTEAMNLIRCGTTSSSELNVEVDRES